MLPPNFRIYLPEDAGMPTKIDVWRVVPSNFTDVARDAAWLTVVARLKEGVTLERAQQEMDALARRLRETYQEHANTNMQIVLNSMHGRRLALHGAAGGDERAILGFEAFRRRLISAARRDEHGERQERGRQQGSASTDEAEDHGQPHLGAGTRM